MQNFGAQIRCIMGDVQAVNTMNCEGSMAEWLGRWTWNLEAQILSPILTAT